MIKFRVIDIETTGDTPPEAEVLEVGFQDLEYGDTIIRPKFECGFALFGVERECPPHIMAVHHILPSEIEGLAPLDQQMYEATINVLHDTPDYYVAHNAAFEAKFLTEFSKPWICTYKSALRVWPDMKSYSNQAVFYALEGYKDTSIPVKSRMPPHRAMPDAVVTAYILEQLLRNATVEELLQWSNEPRLLPRCPIGKFRDQPWADVEKGFLEWMLKQADLDEDFKWNAEQELERRRRALVNRMNQPVP